MIDWRLDSSTGGSNLPIEGVVCAAGVLGADAFKYSGGGFGSMTWMPLEKVCDDHIVVQGGRVLHRGFTVDREAMAIRFERTIPEHVQFYVVGLGRVLKERPKPWYAVRHDLDSMFPTPGGIRFGYHPYQEQLYGPANDTCAINRRFARRTQYFTSYQTSRDATMIYTAGRLDSDRFLALGAATNNLVEWNARTQESRVVGKVATGSENGAYLTNYNRHYAANLFPNSRGDFYQLPRSINAPVVKWGRDGTRTILEVGQTLTLADPTATAPSTTCGVNTYIRLFDGRAFGVPNYHSAAYPGVFVLFDPETEAFEVMTYADLGLTVSGTTRWKNPIQGRDGKVYALPATFPGNLTLVFDPETVTAETHDFGIDYPRADILHTGGIATADNRIVFMQTHGAATDVNNLLILDLDGRTRRITDLGIPKSLFDGALYQEFMTGDGACVFVNNGNGETTAYQGIVYNWATDAYNLFQTQHIPAGTERASGMASTPDARLTTGLTRFKLWNDRGGCVWHERYHVSYDYYVYGAQFFESPPVSNPGPYERLMYYGPMM